MNKRCMRNGILLLVLIVAVAFVIFRYWDNNAYVTDAEITGSEFGMSIVPNVPLFFGNNMSPGDKVTELVKVKNEGNAGFSFSVHPEKESGDDILFEKLTLEVTKVGEVQPIYSGLMKESSPIYVDNLQVGDEEGLSITIGSPLELGNECQGKTLSIKLAFLATAILIGGEDPKSTIDQKPAVTKGTEITSGGLVTSGPATSGALDWSGNTKEHGDSAPDVVPGTSTAFEPETKTAGAIDITKEVATDGAAIVEPGMKAGGTSDIKNDITPEAVVVEPGTKVVGTVDNTKEGETRVVVEVKPGRKTGRSESITNQGTSVVGALETAKSRGKIGTVGNVIKKGEHKEPVIKSLETKAGVPKSTLSGDEKKLGVTIKQGLRPESSKDPGIVFRIPTFVLYGFGILLGLALRKKYKKL